MNAQTPVAGKPWQGTAEALWEVIAPFCPGFSVEILPEIDSTNTELMRRARAGRIEPVLLVAEHQSAGRGRQGKAWHSAPGASLTFSLGMALAPADWSGLSLAVGLALAEQLQPAGRGAEPWVGLKWPNDLWMQGAGPTRKLGGILIETASIAPEVAASWHVPAAARYVVVGTGLNVQPRPAEGLNLSAGCLQELDSHWDGPAALLAVAPALVQALQSFAQTGFAPLQPRFAQRDVLLGQPVHLSDGTRGVACGVAADGALWIDGPQGRQEVRSNEVSVRPQDLALPAGR